jgi:membrane-bound lytic murein transglycosylase D
MKALSLHIVFMLCLFGYSLKAQTVVEDDSSQTVVAGTESLVVDTSVVLAPKAPLPGGDTVYKATYLSDEVLSRRLKNIQDKVPLTYNSTVRKFIIYFADKRPGYILEMERRRNLYFPIFEEQLAKYGLPDEIKYLSIVESGLNPRAISWAGAGGLWQFMPATGRMFKLTLDEYVDERFDPTRGTEAACVFVKQLYASFNDWHLALAAYNCGPGNVRRAIRRSGYQKTFWQIYDYLPKETRSYVPSLIAVIYAMNYQQEHRIIADSLQFIPRHERIVIEGFVNFDILCAQLDVCMEDFKMLNPHFQKNIVSGDKPVNVSLPEECLALFYSKRKTILDAAGRRDLPVRSLFDDKASKISNSGSSTTSIASTTTTTGGGVVTTTRVKSYYTVKAGDNLSTIATRNGVTVTQLKEWNGLKSNIIYAGQKLILYKYVKTVQPAPVKPSTNSAVKTTPTSVDKPEIYVVETGDTLWSITRKYPGVSVDDIKKKNNLSTNTILPGQKLIL